jgi:hypothetical protein
MAAIRGQLISSTLFVPIQVGQAAIDPARRAAAFPAIPLERTRVTGLTHVDGAISRVGYHQRLGKADHGSRR